MLRLHGIFALVVAEFLGVQPRAAPVFQECRRIERELARITAEWGVRAGLRPTTA